jgi:hypothetical protein
MAHFYDCNNEPFLNEDVTTPAQAKKKTKVYPSVTTILSIMKDSFIDNIYRPRMMTDLARKYPDLVWQEIEKLCYGTREHPVTGDTVYSSDFGTAVHHEIEKQVSEIIVPTDEWEEDCWSEFAYPFVEWINDNKVIPVGVEELVTCDKIKTAGSVDFIGYKDDKVILCDYKVRTNTKGKAKTYPKDCYQLAIEADIIKRKSNLDYLPECISVIIDADTREHHHKVWKDAEKKNGIQIFKDCAKLYWRTRMK